MECLGCEKEFKLTNKDLGIMLRPNQEIELDHVTYQNAVYFYCSDCRKYLDEQGIDEVYLYEYLRFQQLHELLATLPNSQQKQTAEAFDLAQQVVTEREIHTDAMKAMDRWYAREYKDLKADWKRKDVRIRELEEENRNLKRQLEVQIQIQQPKFNTNIHSVRPFFSNLLYTIMLFGGLQYR